MSLLIYPFWSKNENRLRAFWRILIHFIVFIVLTVVLALPVGFLGGMASSTTIPAWFNAASAALSLVSMLITLFLMARYIDNRPSIKEYGLQLDRKWWKDLVFGLILGIVLMAGIFAVELALGWVRITDTFYVQSSGSFLVAISLAVLMFISVGIYEEMLSRGYHMRNIAEGLHFLTPRFALVLGWILSAAIFGLLHAANPNASLISTLNISLAGLLLGLPVLLTGRLGAAIGLHITWNFAQGNIFGFPVSGTGNAVTFIAIEQGGPELWTGGLFGPEAGLLGLIAMLIGAILIIVWVHWQDQGLQIHEQYANYPVSRKSHEIYED